MTRYDDEDDEEYSGSDYPTNTEEILELLNSDNGYFDYSSELLDKNDWERHKHFR